MSNTDDDNEFARYLASYILENYQWELSGEYELYKIIKEYLDNSK